MGRYKQNQRNTNEYTKYKPRLNTQKTTLGPTVWTGPGSCTHGKLPMYSLNARDHFNCSPLLFSPPPLPFGRICFVVLVMRKGGESSWSGPWHLGCTLEVFHVYSYQDQFIQPSWAKCVFCVFSLVLYFVYSFVFLWYVCVSPSFYVCLGSWVISFTVFGFSVTNLNEPPRALAACTIAWVRS